MSETRGSGLGKVNLDKPEKITAGWTDSQIKHKTVSEFDSMIMQSNMAIQSIKDTLQQEEARLLDLLSLKSRKLELGN